MSRTRFDARNNETLSLRLKNTSNGALKDVFGIAKVEISDSTEIKQTITDVAHVSTGIYSILVTPYSIISGENFDILGEYGESSFSLVYPNLATVEVSINTYDETDTLVSSVPTTDYSLNSLTGDLEVEEVGSSQKVAIYYKSRDMKSSWDAGSYTDKWTIFNAEDELPIEASNSFVLKDTDSDVIFDPIIDIDFSVWLDKEVLSSGSNEVLTAYYRSDIELSSLPTVSAKLYFINSLQLDYEEEIFVTDNKIFLPINTNGKIPGVYYFDVILSYAEEEIHNKLYFKIV